MEWSKKTYNEKYDTWMPWVQDNFLYYFTKDNKVSYATKEQLDKGKVTNIKQVDTLQDGVGGVVAGQVGQGGLLQPVGDAVSKEGVNRSQRAGQDDKGGYMPDGVPGLSGGGKKEEKKEGEGVTGYLPSAKNIPIVGGLSK